MKIFLKEFDPWREKLLVFECIANEIVYEI